MFECPDCLKIFKRKYNYERHMQSKQKCLKIVSTTNTLLLSDFQCPGCNKMYSNKGNLKRHIENPTASCAIMIMSEKVDNIHSILQEKGIGNTTIINNQITNQTVNNQQITFSKPGLECIEHIINVLKKKF